MLRIFARRYARRKYLWKFEVEAATNDINAALSAYLAHERHVNADRLNHEANEMALTITRVGAEEEEKKKTEEYGKLTRHPNVCSTIGSNLFSNSFATLVTLSARFAKSGPSPEPLPDG